MFSHFVPLLFVFEFSMLSISQILQFPTFNILSSSLLLPISTTYQNSTHSTLCIVYSVTHPYVVCRRHNSYFFFFLAFNTFLAIWSGAISLCHIFYANFVYAKHPCTICCECRIGSQTWCWKCHHYIHKMTTVRTRNMNFESDETMKRWNGGAHISLHFDVFLTIWSREKPPTRRQWCNGMQPVPDCSVDCCYRSSSACI